VAEYTTRFVAEAAGLFAGFLVAASVGVAPILTRPTSASGPIQKKDFLFT
jgi:hypothetical protein